MALSPDNPYAGKSKKGKGTSGLSADNPYAKPKPSKKSKPKKGKKRKGFKGLVGNLVDDAGGAAHAFFPAMGDLAEDVAHDTVRGVTGKRVGWGSKSFKSDDAAKDMWKGVSSDQSYTGQVARKWNARLHGDGEAAAEWKRKSYKSMYKHPLDPLLAIATIPTGGGALVGRGALTVARSGVKRGNPHLGAARLAGVDAATGARLSYRVQSPDMPSRGGLHGDVETGGFTRYVKTNPTARARQELVERGISKLPASVQNRRIALHKKASETRAAMRERMLSENPLVKQLHSMKRAAVRGLPVAYGGHRLEQMGDMYDARIEQVQAEIARKKGGRVNTEAGDEFVVEEQLGLPAPKSTSTDLDVRDPEPPPTVSGTPAVPLAIGPGEVATPKVRQDILDMVAKADRGESLQRNQENLAYLLKRKQDVQNLVDDGFDMDADDVAVAVEEARALSDKTSGAMVKAGMDPKKVKSRKTLESEIMYAMGVVDDVYESPAIRSHQTRKDQIGNAKPTSPKFTPGAQPGETRRGTGYNFFNGRDEWDARTPVRSYRNVWEFQRRAQRFQSMLDEAPVMSVDEAAELRGSHVILDRNAPMRKRADRLHDLLVDGEDVFRGSPMYEQMKDAIRRSIIGADEIAPDGTNMGGAAQTVSVVPKAYYEELMGDFTRSTSLLTKLYDKPTAVWRALVLNLRPAWIVNNMVGQMLLLMRSHGMLGGLMAYVQQFGRKGKLVDELAPDVTAYAQLHEDTEFLRQIGGGQSKLGIPVRGIKRSAEWMAQLNAKLTDNHTRRAALIATISPDVKRLQKANPKLTFEQAARRLWRDKDYQDHVAQKVLDDMVDFDNMSEFERSVVRRAIPFYSWLKGSTKIMSKMVADEPWKVALGAYLGEQKVEELFEQHGEDWPRYLLGNVSVPGKLVEMLGVEEGSRWEAMLSTAALNPFVTPADILSRVLGFAVPTDVVETGNPFSDLNPIPKSFIEAGTEKSLFLNQNLNPDGSKSFGRILGERLTDNPQTQWLRKSWGADGTTKHSIINKNPRLHAVNYAGIPIKLVDKKAGEEPPKASDLVAQARSASRKKLKAMLKDERITVRRAAQAALGMELEPYGG